MDIEIMKTSFCLSTTYIEKSIVKCEEPFRKSNCLVTSKISYSKIHKSRVNYCPTFVGEFMKSHHSLQT